MSKPVKFAHVVYQTRRYEEMIAWYETVFGATIVHRDPALAFLTYDDEHHRFAFANLSVLNPEGGDHRAEVGVNHVAYTYATAGDLLSNYERLKAKGILPYWPIHHGPTLSMYYADPDGNRMELQVDACAVDAANAYMRSDAFAANPIGVVYDPDSLLGRWKAGASEDELLAMPAGPPSAIPAAHGF